MTKEPDTSPFGRKLHKDLIDAGARGIEVSDLKVAGAARELKHLSSLGYAVSLGGTIYLSVEAYQEHARAITDRKKPGDEVSIAEARERTGLSRRYLLPILKRMESDGRLKRTGDIRIVLEAGPAGATEA